MAEEASALIFVGLRREKPLPASGQQTTYSKSGHGLNTTA